MKYSRPILILITCILFFFNFKGEIIPVNNGMGWDGRLYGNYTAMLDSAIIEKKINEYRFQRILMSVVLNKTMKAFNIDFTIANIVLGFKIFNLIFLLIALLYYLLISRKLGFTPINEMLGLAALFWCFPILKIPGYNPIITDVGAFAMGMMVVYHFFSNHRIVNICLILLGSFVYPTFLLFGLLVIFPREAYTSSDKTYRKDRIIFPLLYLLIFCIAYFGYQAEFSDTYANINPTNKNMLWLSILIAVSYCYFIGAFFPDFQKIKEAFQKINWLYVIPLIGIFIFVKYLTHTYATPQPQQMSTGRYIINIMKQSVANPGVFIVSHIIYFGLIPIILIWMKTQIVAVIRANGYGLTILLIGIGFMSLGSESRQLINFYPLFVILVILALQNMKPIKPIVAYGFVIVSLLLSRFWYIIGTEGDLSTKLLEYPAQRYFQFFGPWMNNQVYLQNFVIVISILFGFLILQKTGNLFELKELKSKLKPATHKKRK
ncbi:MAG TPA: hypothetical protein VK590_10975 [Saprospiraceae bacterium]|nr:hypothetical protein [Saprospiraceae bacterium]